MQLCEVEYIFWNETVDPTVTELDCSLYVIIIYKVGLNKVQVFVGIYKLKKILEENKRVFILFKVCGSEFWNKINVV